MSMPADLVNDVYQGVKQGLSKAPLLWGSTLCLWAAAVAVYLWVYPTLARSAEVKLIETKVDIVLRIAMEQQLRDMVRIRCDSPATAYWPLQIQIQKQAGEYESLTRKEWKEPTCEEARR